MKLQPVAEFITQLLYGTVHGIETDGPTLTLGDDRLEVSDKAGNLKLTHSKKIAGSWHAMTTYEIEPGKSFWSQLVGLVKTTLALDFADSNQVIAYLLCAEIPGSVEFTRERAVETKWSPKPVPKPQKTVRRAPVMDDEPDIMDLQDALASG